MIEARRSRTLQRVSEQVIAAGLEVIGRLASREAWAASCEGDPSAAVRGAAEALAALAAAVPNERAYERRFHAALLTLRAALEGWAAGHDVLPEEVEQAARACRGPLPVAPSRPPEEPPRFVGRHAPVRAMAVGGGRTEVYPAGEDPELADPVQAIVEELVERSQVEVAFVIDRHGQLHAAAGDTAGVDTLEVAHLRASEAASPAMSERLARDGEILVLIPGDTGALILLVARRLILAALFVGRSKLDRLRIAAGDASRAIEAILDELPPAARPRLPELTDEDIRGLFGDEG